MMSEINLPWKCIEGSGEVYSDVEGENIEINLWDIVDSKGDILIGFPNCFEDEVKHVVEAVNAYDTLTARVAELEQEVDYLKEILSKCVFGGDGK